MTNEIITEATLMELNRDPASLFIESVANDIELDATLDKLMYESKIKKNEVTKPEVPVAEPQPMKPRRTATARLKEMIRAILDKITSFLNKIENHFKSNDATVHDIYRSELGGEQFYMIEDQVYARVENQVAESSKLIQLISRGAKVEPRKVNEIIEKTVTPENVKKVAVNGAKAKIIYTDGLKKIKSYQKHLNGVNSSLANELSPEDQSTISKLIASANRSIGTILSGTMSAINGKAARENEENGKISNKVKTKIRRK